MKIERTQKKKKIKLKFKTLTKKQVEAKRISAYKYLV
jgi:hypothetical protein